MNIDKKKTPQGASGQCACNLSLPNLVRLKDLEHRVEALENVLNKMSYVHEDAHREIFKGFQPRSD